MRRWNLCHRSATQGLKGAFCALCLSLKEFFVASLLGGAVRHSFPVQPAANAGSMQEKPSAVPQKAEFVAEFEQQVTHLVEHGDQTANPTVNTLLDVGVRIKAEVNSTGSFTMPRDPSDDVLALLTSLSVKYNVPNHPDHGRPPQDQLPDGEMKFPPAGHFVPEMKTPPAHGQAPHAGQISGGAVAPQRSEKEIKKVATITRGLATFSKHQRTKDNSGLSSAEFCAQWITSGTGLLSAIRRLESDADKHQMLAALCKALMEPAGRSPDLAVAAESFIKTHVDPELPENCNPNPQAARDIQTARRGIHAMTLTGLGEQIDALQIPANLLFLDMRSGKSGNAAEVLWLKAVEDVGKSGFGAEVKIDLFTRLRQHLETSCNAAEDDAPNTARLGEFEWGVLDALNDQARSLKPAGKPLSREQYTAIFGQTYVTSFAGRSLAAAGQAEDLVRPGCRPADVPENGRGASSSARPSLPSRQSPAARSAATGVGSAAAGPDAMQASTPAQVTARIAGLRDLPFAGLQKEACALAIDINNLQTGTAQKADLYVSLHGAAHAVFEDKRNAYLGFPADVKPAYAKQLTDSRAAVYGEIGGYLGGLRNQPGVSDVAKELAHELHVFSQSPDRLE